MANIINSGKVYKEFGVKTGENTSEFFEIGADAKNVFIQNAEHTQYGDVDGVVDLQTKLDNFNKSVRNIGSGVATKTYAAAFGQSTQANGQGSHSEGYQTIADGNFSHTEGCRVFAQGEGAHAEGYYRRGVYLRIIDGQEGYLLLDQNKTNLPNWLNGYYWDAGFDSVMQEGAMPLQGLKLYDVQNTSLLKATILKTYTVENNGNYDLYAILDTDLRQEIEQNPDRGYYLYYGKAAGSGSHSEGGGIAMGTNAHAEGSATWAAHHGHAEGFMSAAMNTGSHAEGIKNCARGSASHAEGRNTVAEGDASHAEGCQTIAKGDYSHAEGYKTSVGPSAWDLGGLSLEECVSHQAAHTEGIGTQAEGKASHAEGFSTKALGDVSHAEGYNTLAEGAYSHAEGENTQVLGRNSHVEGFNNISLESAYNSHVEGSSNRLVSGSDCHIEGRGHQDWEIKSDNLVFYTISNNSIYLDYYKIGAVETLSEAEKIDGRMYSYQYLYSSSSSLNLPEISQGEEDIKYYRGYLWVGRNLTEYQQNNIILKQKFANNQYHNVLLCIEPIPGNFPAPFVKNLIFNEKGTIVSQEISGIISDAAHVQGRYSLLEEGFSHIVGGGTSLNDRRNIHTLDWGGNAEFAGDVTLFGCGGPNPIQLSSLTKGPLVIQESMISAYSGQGNYGDKILDAIQKNRQILILLNNQGGSNYSLYSPVITYHLPYEANTELSLFYLPDGISPTNLNIKEAQFMVSNPITFNDNLKN